MHETVIREFVEMINAHDLGRLADVVTADVEEEGPIVVDAPTGGGIGTMRAGWQQMLDSFPDIRITIDDMIESGDRLAARISLRATNTGHYRRADATNQYAEWTGFLWITMRDGKIARFHGQTDRFAVLQQLGFIGSDDELAAAVTSAGEPPEHQPEPRATPAR
jgi:predicted ester cyclase